MAMAASQGTSTAIGEEAKGDEKEVELVQEQQQ